MPRSARWPSSTRSARLRVGRHAGIVDEGELVAAIGGEIAVNEVCCGVVGPRGIHFPSSSGARELLAPPSAASSRSASRKNSAAVGPISRPLGCARLQRCSSGTALRLRGRKDKRRRFRRSSSEEVQALADMQAALDAGMARASARSRAATLLDSTVRQPAEAPPLGVLRRVRRVGAAPTMDQLLAGIAQGMAGAGEGVVFGRAARRAAPPALPKASQAAAIRWAARDAVPQRRA